MSKSTGEAEIYLTCHATMQLGSIYSLILYFFFELLITFNNDQD